MRTPVAALVLCLGAALAGCSDDGSAAPAPLPTVASPTAAPVPSPPALASEMTVEGAEAFVRFYFTALDAAYYTGDPALLESLSAEGCEGCSSLSAAVREIASRGERQTAGAIRVEDVAVPPVESGDVIAVAVISGAAKAFEDRSGRVVATTQPVPPTGVELRLIRRGSAWAVQGYRLAES